MDNADQLVLLTQEEKQFLLERNILMDRITELLRDNIVNGHIRPGARLVERQLAEQLGISRVPVREALIQLEQEGLVVSKPGGRYVIKLSEQDIGKLYELRRALERLAVELATQNTSPEHVDALRSKLQEMREAVARQDRSAYVKNDFEIHWLIWQQANNPYLLEVLRILTGPILMFVANNANHMEWQGTLELHEELIDGISSGNTPAAVDSLERHMDDALYRSYQVFQKRKQL